MVASENVFLYHFFFCEHYRSGLGCYSPDILILNRHKT